MATDRYRELLQETVAMVHTVNGSSGSLGFRTLSTAAATLEDMLNDIARSGERPDQADILEANKIFTEIQKIAAVTTPQDSQLFDVNLSRLGQVSRPRDTSSGAA